MFSHISPQHARHKIMQGLCVLAMQSVCSSLILILYKPEQRLIKMSSVFRYLHEKANSQDLRINPSVPKATNGYVCVASHFFALED